jgi:hypothetical protein
MTTIKYKDWIIHYHPENQSYEVCLPNETLWARTQSLLSAKRMITKDITWVKVKL